MLIFLLVNLFILGAIVGSLLNVCIYRIPLEKSIIWPGSRCGHCLQPVRWYDNIPLVSYLVLRGRCRTCGARFSPRYFFIELLTGVSFAGIFYLEIDRNVHGIGPLAGQSGRMAVGLFPDLPAWVFFGFHALLVSFLIVTTFCDFDYREIPLSVTIPGTVLGLIGAVCLPWPWPWTPPALAVAGMPAGQPWWQISPNLGPREGLYPWPFWGPLPASFAPGGNWQTGLVTGLVGAAVGTVMLRIIRYVFTLGLGIEALGLGDADLMMMAGAFLGWQPVVVAFFLGVFAGLIFGLAQLIVRGDNTMPFGPALAVGVVASFLGWESIAPHVQPLCFNAWLMVPLALASCVLMLVSSYALRVMRKFW